MLYLGGVGCYCPHIVCKFEYSVAQNWKPVRRNLHCIQSTFLKNVVTVFRSVEISKNKKREKICASLNDLFSRSGTVAASTDDIPKKARDQQNAAPKNARVNFHEDMLLSECVAYTPGPIEIAPQQAYEEVSLSLRGTAPTEAGPSLQESEPVPLPPRNRKDAPRPLKHNYDDISI